MFEGSTDIGERVRLRREELGRSQEWLARQAGTSQATIDKIENGRSQRSKFLPPVFAALGLPLDELVPTMEHRPSEDRLGGGRERMPLPLSATTRDLPVYSSAEGGP